MSRSLTSVLLALGLAAPATAQDLHVLVVVGIGGDDTYRERFHEWGAQIHDAFTGPLAVDGDHVVYLAERPELDPERIADRSTKANIESSLAAMAAHAGADDRIIVVLVGHGTSRGDEARFNVPGPDLAPADLGAALDAFPTQSVAVVNAASASGAFISPLAGPRRTIATATRTARERNQTWFGRFFAQALASGDTDLDKDGRISLLEAYQYTRREVARYYEEQNLMLTEHATLEDDGDGDGSDEPVEGGDGALAGTFILGGGVETADLEAISDPALRTLYEERRALEERVASLRARREEMDQETYDARLEELLLEIALKNREIRTLEGGGA